MYHHNPDDDDAPNAPSPRILIFIVAYNAKTTLPWVLDRIPASLRRENVEVLVIDDSSPDDTFHTGLDYVRTHHDDSGLKITVLRNPENQRYGGNQKLGYRYAIEHGFDFVALVHGDGQYAPECLPDLLAPLIAGEADAVFGSRMITAGGARRGGMPLYKFVGNKLLTRFQNHLLGTDLTEFHSGYRLYAVHALEQIPFECNTNDFHFDTEIIIQCVLAGLRIKELPIPTYYGDEVCRVDGIKYAWDVCKTMLRARVHQADLLYDRKFDVGTPGRSYELKLDYPSSHTFALDAARPGNEVLNVVGSKADLSPELVHRACHVTNLGGASNDDIPTVAWNLQAAEFPVDVSRYDQIFLLDVIEQPARPGAVHGGVAFRRAPPPPGGGHRHGERRVFRDAPDAALRPVQLRSARHPGPHAPTFVHVLVPDQAAGAVRLPGDRDARRARAVPAGGENAVAESVPAALQSVPAAVRA